MGRILGPALAGVGAALLLAACGGGEGEAGPATTIPGGVPPVDLARHSVPLADVVFDTFDGSFLRLTESTEAERRRLRDVIAPIYEPVYGNADDLAWLEDGDLVLGYDSGSGAYAYPLKVLNLRGLVNDEIDGEPVLVSYCPLCGSAVVYSREVAGRTLLFGNTSALYESDLVMFDHQTGSYWYQVRGEAIVGELTGTRLRALPSTTLPWVEWKRLHPDTRLLVADGAERLGERYAADPFVGYGRRVDEGEFAFPVPEERLDGRLRASEVVVAVEVGSSTKAYPPGLIAEAVVNDEVGGESVVLFFPAGGGSATAFLAGVDGRTLRFEGRDHTFRDRETGSTWDAAGRAVAGPLTGTALEPLPTRRAFWFSLALATPGVELYGA